MSNKVSFEDFLVEGLVQEGAWGKVFGAKRISDGVPLALKFFGYTKNRPNSVDIANEIRSMSQLIGVEGSVQLIGVFKDSPEGLLPGKNPDWHQSYPVIVMEMLNGGDILTHLATKKQLSERHLADIFRSIVISVSTIHKKGFLHRDIKLCNLMTFSSPTGHSPQTKLIDFGFMLDLSTASSRACASSSSFDTVVTDILVGTEGFFAPESLLKCEYSRKSDIWQLGCVLYAMLVGYHPFSTQKRYRTSILSGSYFPMTTTDWQQISPQGKDLVSKLLQVKPCDRLEIEDILKHPWITTRSLEASGSSEVFLGEGYQERIKLMASHRLQYLPLGMSQSEADTKPSQLATESTEKRQKLDHNEGKLESDGCEPRSLSPVHLRRSDSDTKKSDCLPSLKSGGDPSCRNSPSLDEEQLQNSGR